MDKLIEGVDYFCHFVKFANRANPALTVVNPDGTYDVYFNTLYETERLREELPHELRHILERHFDVDISVERAERQADGEPLCIIGHTAPDRIPHFFSEDHFAKLLPPDGAIPLLESDYAHMKNMIFGPKPPFSEILDTIASLEEEIHSHA